MKVCELIEALMAMPQDATVVIAGRNYELETPAQRPELKRVEGYYSDLPDETKGEGDEPMFPGLSAGDAIVVL